MLGWRVQVIDGQGTVSGQTNAMNQAIDLRPDGSISAYDRIRQGDYQAATIPEPLNLDGWQCVDEMNRAFAGAPPSGYVTPVHLVTKDNINVDGGPRNIFDPGNGYRDQYKKIWGV